MLFSILYCSKLYRCLWQVQILFVRLDFFFPMQKSASKSDVSPYLASLTCACFLIVFFIAEWLLCLPKSSESIDLHEGYVIFTDFKNAIKTKIKTGYIKSSISIESSFHVEYNELGFNSVPHLVGSKNKIFGR